MSDSKEILYYQCPACGIELRLIGETRHQPIYDAYMYYTCQNPNCENHLKKFFTNNKPKINPYEEFTPIITKTKPISYDDLIRKRIKEDAREKGKWMIKRKSGEKKNCEICHEEILPGERVFKYSWQYYYTSTAYEHEKCHNMLKP